MIGGVREVEEEGIQEATVLVHEEAVGTVDAGAGGLQPVTLPPTISLPAQFLVCGAARMAWWVASPHQARN